MIFFIFSMILTFIILLIFFLLSKKFKWSIYNSSIFECGFTSYFFSRFSFSSHYFLIGLMFLFLDLELCFLLPFLILEFSNFKMVIIPGIFIMILLAGLLEEWAIGKLDWKF